MAEQNNTTLPWQMEWGAIRAQESPPSTPVGTPEMSQMPWDMEWGTLPTMDDESIQRFNETTGISPTFDTVFDRLIQAESRGRHRDESGRLTSSPVGAKGITQIMPKTGRNPGYGIKPLQDDSEEEYIRFGKDYLKAMLGEFGGDYKKALAAYNAGPASVQRAVERGGSNWIEFLPKRKETIPYINRILGEG